MDAVVVSADSHVLEPFDLWERSLGSKYGDRVPRVVKRFAGRDGTFFFCGVTVLSINLVGDGLNDALNPRTTTMTPAAGAVESPQVDSPLPESAPRAPVAAGP